MPVRAGGSAPGGTLRHAHRGGYPCAPARYRHRRSSHARPPLPWIRHAEPSCRPAPRPHDRSPGGPHLPERLVRLSRRRPRGGALQPRALRACLLAPVQPDQRDARGAGRGARRAGSGRSPSRADRPRSISRSRPSRARATTSSPRAPFTAAATTSSSTPCPASGSRPDVRGPARRRSVPGRHPPGDEASLRRDGRQPGLRGAGHPGRRRGGPRRGASSPRRQHVRHPLALPARSSSAPTSSTTARPSS